MNPWQAIKRSKTYAAEKWCSLQFSSQECVVLCITGLETVGQILNAALLETNDISERNKKDIVKFNNGRSQLIVEDKDNDIRRSDDFQVNVHANLHIKLKESIFLQEIACYDIIVDFICFPKYRNDLCTHRGNITSMMFKHDENQNLDVYCYMSVGKQKLVLINDQINLSEDYKKCTGALRSSLLLNNQTINISASMSTDHTQLAQMSTLQEPICKRMIQFNEEDADFKSMADFRQFVLNNTIEFNAVKLSQDDILKICAGRLNICGINPEFPLPSIQEHFFLQDQILQDVYGKYIHSYAIYGNLKKQNQFEISNTMFANAKLTRNVTISFWRVCKSDITSLNFIQKYKSLYLNGQYGSILNLLKTIASPCNTNLKLDKIESKDFSSKHRFQILTTTNFERNIDCRFNVVYNGIKFNSTTKELMMIKHFQPIVKCIQGEFTNFLNPIAFFNAGCNLNRIPNFYSLSKCCFPNIKCSKQCENFPIKQYDAFVTVDAPLELTKLFQIPIDLKQYNDFYIQLQNMTIKNVTVSKNKLAPFLLIIAIHSLVIGKKILVYSPSIWFTPVVKKKYTASEILVCYQQGYIDRSELLIPFNFEHLSNEFNKLFPICFHATNYGYVFDFLQSAMCGGYCVQVPSASNAEIVLLEEPEPDFLM